MFKTSRIIGDAISEYRECFIGEGQDSERIEVPIDTERGTVKLIFYTNENSNAINVMTDSLGCLPNPQDTNNKALIGILLNKLSRQIPYYKFFYHDDGRIKMAYDVPSSITDNAIAKVVLDLCVQAVQCLDFVMDQIAFNLNQLRNM